MNLKNKKLNINKIFNKYKKSYFKQINLLKLVCNNLLKILFLYIVIKNLLANKSKFIYA